MNALKNLMILKWFFLLSFMKFKTEHNIHDYLADHFCPEFMDRHEFDENEMLLRDLPGPVGLRYACYVGEKVNGFSGALIALAAMLCPVFIYTAILILGYNFMYGSGEITALIATYFVNGMMASALGLIAAHMFKIVYFNKIGGVSMGIIVPTALICIFLPSMAGQRSLPPIVYIIIVILIGTIASFFYTTYMKHKAKKESSPGFYLDPYSRKAKKQNDKRLREEEDKFRRGEYNSDPAKINSMDAQAAKKRSEENENKKGMK